MTNMQVGIMSKAMGLQQVTPQLWASTAATSSIWHPAEAAVAKSELTAKGTPTNQLLTRWSSVEGTKALTEPLSTLDQVPTWRTASEEERLEPHSLEFRVLKEGRRCTSSRADKL